MIDARKTITERMGFSAMRKFNHDNAPYSYKSAILLEGLYKASRVLKNDDIFNYVRNLLGQYVHEDGTVEKYRLEEHSMDDIRMGNIMLEFYGLTGDERYRKGLDSFREMLRTQPRTPEGGFWHKKIYPDQMWLDGLYMQGPFYAGYCRLFGGLKDCLEDIVPQFELIYEKTYDPATGLLRHAWDSSQRMPWCEPGTGRSREVWSRAMGWYCMALADLLEDIPAVGEYEPYRKRLLAIALKLAPAVRSFQDKNGLWWQVMDKAGVGANYPETSSTSMFAYFFAKMNRLGHLDSSYRDAAWKAMNGMMESHVTVKEDGELCLHGTCKSAGLGKSAPENPYRPADFEYYCTGEPVETDNLHGVSPFISAAVELEFPGQLVRERYVVRPTDDLGTVIREKAGKAVVVIPSGHRTTGPLDIPSHSHIVFEEGAVLDFTDDFEAYPPVWTRWEGVSCWAMHPCFMIKDATDVVVEGPGTLDGHGKKWWDYILGWKNGGRPAKLNLPIEKKLADLNPGYLTEPGGGGGRPCQFLRPPLLQILDSENVRIDGLTLTGSPFWTCHPVCTTNLQLLNITIDNPSDSPNTDGIDIESCVNVSVRGCIVNVGDDGIAVNCGSGREMMGFQRSENIVCEDCTVRNAHGGFVIGSETASGVKGATVRDCRFIGTDRGIRIKTRRGRGGHMTDITASGIFMDEVICPISINMFYRCGSDEPSLYSMEMQPVDDTTPLIKDVLIERIEAKNCRSSAAFLAGLPERKLGNVVIKDSTFEVKDYLEEGLEAEMCNGIPGTDYRGIRIINADVVISNVKVNVEPQVLFEKI
ncbi:MAG: glycoside hydrolase family 88 protein [Spirochaetales bacterium]|nr:glycoside hydrolase family 88 protein [Spirochaetales bacterium]